MNSAHNSFAARSTENLRRDSLCLLTRRLPLWPHMSMNHHLGCYIDPAERYATQDWAPRPILVFECCSPANSASAPTRAGSFAPFAIRRGFAAVARAAWKNEMAPSRIKTRKIARMTHGIMPLLLGKQNFARLELLNKSVWAKLGLALGWPDGYSATRRNTVVVSRGTSWR